MIWHSERVCAADNMARFYRVELCRTLFGEWVLVRVWGRIGSFGRRREERFGSRNGAEVALQALVRAKQRRGYRPVPLAG